MPQLYLSLILDFLRCRWQCLCGLYVGAIVSTNFDFTTSVKVITSCKFITSFDFISSFDFVKNVEVMRVYHLRLILSSRSYL